MTRTTSNLLSASETAHVLRQALWPRQWRDFLADCVRNRAGLHGHLQLMPYARDKSRHPLYRPIDIRIFIAEARRLDPTLVSKAKVVAHRYAHDDTIGLPWTHRVATLASGGVSA